MVGLPGERGERGERGGRDEADAPDTSDDPHVADEPDEREVLPRLEETDDARMVVLDDRPLVAAVVRSGSVALEIRSLEGSVEVTLRGPFRLVRGGEARELDATRPAGLAPLLPVVGGSVERISVSPAGGLTVRLSGGEVVEVRGGFGARRWTLQGSGDLEVAPDFLSGAAPGAG